MPPEINEGNDHEEEVITLNGNSDPANDTQEDRGDVVDTGVGIDDLKDLVKDAPNEHAKEEHEKPANFAPGFRLKEEAERRREAERLLEEAQAELEALRAQSKSPTQTTEGEPAFDEVAAEIAYQEAFMEGDSAKAAAIRSEINSNLRAQAVADSRQALRADAEASEQARIDALLQAEAKIAYDAYPYLKTEAGAEASTLIIAARDRNISLGQAPDVALRNAVASIAPKFAPDSEGGETPTKPLATDTRTASAIARGIKDSASQPASLQDGTGNRATAGRINVETMTEKQFENLPEAEKKRLRGDM